MNTSTEQIDYQLQADAFLKATGTSFKAVYKTFGRFFDNDPQSRDVWRITLKNANGSFTFSFGQSINNSGIAPTPYDVLSCLTKYDPGSYEDFCSEFGYESYNENYTGKNKATNKIYKAVCKEFEAIERLFSSEEIEQLQEIQ